MIGYGLSSQETQNQMQENTTLATWLRIKPIPTGRNPESFCSSMNKHVVGEGASQKARTRTAGSNSFRDPNKKNKKKVLIK